jgi:bacterial/archaeal transporter family-2 protein
VGCHPFFLFKYFLFGTGGSLVNKWLAIALAFTAGILTSIQPAINAALGQHIGIFEAALVSFLVGLSVLALIIILRRKGSLFAARGLPPVYFTGGLMGVVAVSTMIVVVPRVGSGIGMITVLSGQMLMAAIIDALGLLGVEKIPIRPNRIVGLVLLFLSMGLIIGRI